MNHDDSKQIILQLLQQKEKATNKEMIRLIGGDEELFGKFTRITLKLETVHSN